jgi:SulP family sulfate permease
MERWVDSGIVFFGTISAVEAEIRKLLDLAKWQHNPIRFLIIDFALVHGLDFSSAEAFVRVQRLLAAKDVLLILCGAAPEGLVGTALRSVDLWADSEGSRVEVFTDLNDALEWTENAYLWVSDINITVECCWIPGSTAFYENQQKAESNEAARRIEFPKVAKPPFSLAESFQNSPRRTHLAKAGDENLPYCEYELKSKSENPFTGSLHVDQTSQSNNVDNDKVNDDSKPSTPSQPVLLLNQTFGSYLLPDSVIDTQTFLTTIAPYFTQFPVSPNQILWRQNDSPDGLYMIEKGSLRATYAYDDRRELIQETMVAGTIAGDLSTLSETCRNCTVVSEGEGVLWKMDMEGLKRLEKQNPQVARLFIQVVLKGEGYSSWTRRLWRAYWYLFGSAVAEEQDVLSSHLIAVLS